MTRVLQIGNCKLVDCTVNGHPIGALVEETDGEPEALPCPFCGELNDVAELLAGQDEWVDTECYKCKKQFQFSTDYSAYCEARAPKTE